MFLLKKKMLVSMLALLLGMMTAPIDVSAQDKPGVMLTGTVTDASSQEAVTGAEISVESVDTGKSDQTTTGKEGQYSFKNLKPGMYIVTVKAEGYQDWQQETQIKEKGTTLDIMLKPTDGLFLLSYLAD